MTAMLAVRHSKRHTHCYLEVPLDSLVSYDSSVICSSGPARAQETSQARVARRQQLLGLRTQGLGTCLVLAGMSQGEEEEVKWNAELEVALFHSMHGHKPVGEYVFLLLRKNIFEYIQVNRLRCTLF